MSLVIGIDPSLTATGIVVLRDGKLELAETTKNRPELGTIERVREIRQKIITLDVFNEVPALIAIEGFSYGSKGRSVFDIAYLGWRIREDLECLKNDFNIPWLEVPPSQLKQFATGKGNANKEINLQQVYKRWGVEFSDNNQADAYVLAQIGRAYLRYPRDRLPDFQLAVIQSLKGEKPKKKPRKKVGK